MISKTIWLFCLAICLLREPILAMNEVVGGDALAMHKVIESDSNDDYAYEEDAFLPIVLELSDRGNLESAELYIKKLLENPDIKSNQIVLVIDVDGTLTNYSDPDEHQGSAQARGNSVQFIKQCVEKGIRVVVSSAWPDFNATIQRLKDIGLGDALNITTGEIQRGNGRLFMIPVEYACLGLVASVRNTDNDEFFRLKAFAYRYVYPDLDLKTIKHWVFGDDNGDNITFFKDDLFRLYRESQIEKKEMVEDVFVKMFYLSLARGETTLK